ncbi:MAG: tetratricopeptide repeat protein [Candidatus Obscuribacterales bacterium]|nr:tetratricopeptide repeat protein [Candidatus Obscuribacterales bacterium]
MVARVSMSRKLSFFFSALTALASLNTTVNASEITSSAPLMVSPSQKIVLRAYKQIRQGNFDTAIPLLKTAVKIDPENTEAHRYLAYSYLHCGKVTQALSESKQVVDAGSEHPHDYYTIAEANFYDGKPDQAMKFYRDALLLNPLFAEARMGAIRSLMALGKFEQAKEVCRNAAYNSPSAKSKFEFKKMLNSLDSQTQIAASSRTFGS